MRYVTSLPPHVDVPDAVGIRELYRAQGARPVRERLFPPHIVENYARREEAAEHPAPPEKEKRANGERRQLCRRLESVELLLETRSSVERRRKSRRRNDAATSVDEEV